jgi:hypothetical protein
MKDLRVAMQVNPREEMARSLPSLDILCSPFLVASQAELLYSLAKV